MEVVLLACLLACGCVQPTILDQQFLICATGSEGFTTDLLLIVVTGTSAPK